MGNKTYSLYMQTSPQKETRGRQKTHKKYQGEVKFVLTDGEKNVLAYGKLPVAPHERFIFVENPILFSGLTEENIHTLFYNVITAKKGRVVVYIATDGTGWVLAVRRDRYEITNIGAGKVMNHTPNEILKVLNEIDIPPQDNSWQDVEIIRPNISSGVFVENNYHIDVTYQSGSSVLAFIRPVPLVSKHEEEVFSVFFFRLDGDVFLDASYWSNAFYVGKKRLAISVSHVRFLNGYVYSIGTKTEAGKIFMPVEERGYPLNVLRGWTMIGHFPSGILPTENVVFVLDDEDRREDGADFAYNMMLSPGKNVALLYDSQSEGVLEGITVVNDVIFNKELAGHNFTLLSYHIGTFLPEIKYVYYRKSKLEGAIDFLLTNQSIERIRSGSGENKEPIFGRLILGLPEGNPYVYSEPSQIKLTIGM